MPGVKGRSGKIPAGDVEARQKRRLAGSKGGMSKGMPIARRAEAQDHPEDVAAIVAGAEQVRGMARSLGGTAAASLDLDGLTPRALIEPIRQAEENKTPLIDVQAKLNVIIAGWKLVGAKHEHDLEAKELYHRQEAVEFAWGIIDAFRRSLVGDLRTILRELVPQDRLNDTESRLSDAVQAALGAASIEAQRRGGNG